MRDALSYYLNSFAFCLFTFALLRRDLNRHALVRHALGRHAREGRGRLGLFEACESFVVDLYLALLFEAAARVDEVVVEDLVAAFGDGGLDELLALLVELGGVCVLAVLDGDDDPVVADLDWRLRRLARLEREDRGVERGVCARLAERSPGAERVLVFGLESELLGGGLQRVRACGV